MKKLKVCLFVFFSAILLTPTTRALDIVIDDYVLDPIPVAVTPFGWDQPANVAPIDLASIISGNLKRSGRFKTLDEDKLPERPTNKDAINFQNWRLAAMDNLVIGSMTVNTKGEYIIQFHLYNVNTQQELANGRLKSNKASLRRAAHQISDIIYEKLLGVRGAFSTRIAYITVNKNSDGVKTHSLKIADADGENVHTLLNSSEPLMSPSWSPNGRQIAYVSFEDKNSSIIVQDIFNKTRQVVQSGPGINSAPSWSPDGKKLAMTLSKDGNPEIYIKHLDSGLLQRLTKDPAIDTEPNWSPDGMRLVFTSNRAGKPQIYEVRAEGGKAKRLSFEGSYNTRPIYSPNGKEIAVVTGGQGFQIAILNPADGSVTRLTEARLDESPSFAPNGHMIVYTTLGARGSRLAVVSNDGYVKGSVSLQEGEVREPAWGPLLK